MYKFCYFIVNELYEKKTFSSTVMDEAEYQSIPSVKSKFLQSSTYSSTQNSEIMDTVNNDIYMNQKERQTLEKCLLIQAVYGKEVFGNQNWTALRCSKLMERNDTREESRVSWGKHPTKSSLFHSSFSGSSGVRDVKKKRKSSFLPVESLGRTVTAGYENSVDEEWCEFTKIKYYVQPLQSWGKLPQSLQVQWKAGMCDAYFSKARMAAYPIPYCNVTQVQSTDLIAIMAATTSRNILNPSPGQLSLFNMLLPSLMRSVECGYRYVFVLGYDAGDFYYDSVKGMMEVNEWFIENVEKIMATNGIELKMLLVRVNNTIKKPGPVFIEMARRAFEVKADYFYRINDDTELITKWPSLFVNAIGSIQGKIGVVGPICKQGNQQILTHDFVHRTHMEIFEMNYYPPELVDWWMDDWISFVYGKSRSLRVSSVVVLHHTGAHGRRYAVDQTNSAKLAGLVEDGRLKIRNWLIANSADDDTIKKFDKDKYQTIGGTFPLKQWPQ